MKTWREVVHIEISTGELGGRIWVLTLNCGHMAFRRIPRIRLHNLTKFKRREPPARCHCALCADDEEQHLHFQSE